MNKIYVAMTHEIRSIDFDQVEVLVNKYVGFDYEKAEKIIRESAPQKEGEGVIEVWEGGKKIKEIDICCPKKHQREYKKMKEARLNQNNNNNI